MIERNSWVLPEPDSPTTPRLSPGATAKLTSLTAATSPSGVAKRVVSPSTASSEACGSVWSGLVWSERAMAMEVNIYAAKTHLSRLIDQVNAGEEVVITRHGRPVARLVPAEAAKPKRKLGTLKGKIWVSDDFDAPLPDEMLEAVRGQGHGSERGEDI